MSFINFQRNRDVQSIYQATIPVKEAEKELTEYYEMLKEVKLQGLPDEKIKEIVEGGRWRGETPEIVEGVDSPKIFGKTMVELITAIPIKTRNAIKSTFIGNVSEEKFNTYCYTQNTDYMVDINSG